MKYLLRLYILSLFVGANLQAQEEDSLFRENIESLIELSPKEVSLFDVRITSASLNEESARKATALIYVITEEEIKVRGYQSLNDVLMDSPDFKVDNLSAEQANNIITTRGVSGQENFIILLDGVRISSPTNETMPILENYPVHFAKQIEIIYGPASALYGADALTGIINIISKTDNKQAVNIEANTSIGNYETYNTDLYLNTKVGKTSITITGKYYQENQANLPNLYNTEDLDISSHQTGVFATVFGEQIPNQAFEPEYQNFRKAYAIFASLKNENLQLNIFHNYTENSTSNGVKPSNTIYNKNIFYGQGVSTASLNYHKAIRKNISLSSLLMGSIYEVNPNSSFRNVFVNMERGYKYAYGSEIQFRQLLKWQLNTKLNLVSGITTQFFSSIPKSADLATAINKRNSLEATLIGTDIDAKFFSLNYSNIGGFAQFQYAPSEKINLTVGSRLDYNSRFGTTLNPRIGLVVEPINKLSIKLLFGSAFLAPSPEQAFSHYGSFFSEDNGQTYQSFFWRLPNPDLKPIKSQNIELGIRYVANNTLSISLQSYYTILSDLFTSIGDADNENRYNNSFLGWEVDFIEILTNQGRQINYGGNLQIAYKRKWNKNKINAYLSINYVDGNVEQGDKKLELRRIAPFMLKAGIDFSWHKFSIAPRVLMMGQQNMSSFEENNNTKRQKISGYTLLNMNLRYRFYKKSAVFLSAYNLLDLRYRVSNSGDIQDSSNIYLTGSPQLPLRVQLGLQVSL